MIRIWTNSLTCSPRHCEEIDKNGVSNCFLDIDRSYLIPSLHLIFQPWPAHRLRKRAGRALRVLVRPVLPARQRYAPPFHRPSCPAGRPVRRRRRPRTPPQAPSRRRSPSPSPAVIQGWVESFFVMTCCFGNFSVEDYIWPLIVINL